MEQVAIIPSNQNQVENSGGDNYASPPVANNYYENQLIQPSSGGVPAYNTSQGPCVYYDSGNNCLFTNQTANVAQCCSSTSTDNGFVPAPNICYNVNDDGHGGAEGQQHLGITCNSLYCATERERLHGKVQELSACYRILDSSNRETREALAQKELALGLAHDSCKRLQVDLNSEINRLTSRNSALEREVRNSKSYVELYRNVLIRLNAELQNIHGKVAKLYDVGSENGIGPSENQNVTQNNNIIYNGVNQRNGTARLIAQVNLRLDKVLEQQQSLSYPNGEVSVDNVQPINEQFDITENSLAQDHHQDEEMEVKDELPQRISLEQDFSMQGMPDHVEQVVTTEGTKEAEIMSISLCANADQDGIIYTGVDDDRGPLKAEENDSDDDITIVAEIPKSIPAVPLLPPSRILMETNDKPIYSPTLGYFTPERMCTSASGSSEQNLSDTSSSIHVPPLLESVPPCVICNMEFSYNQDLERHLEEIHQIIVMDSCNTCGKRFKGRDQLLRHERMAHDSPKTTLKTTSSFQTSRSNAVAAAAAGSEEQAMALSASQTEHVSLVFNPKDESVTLLPCAPPEQSDSLGRMEQNSSTTILNATTRSNAALVSFDGAVRAAASRIQSSSHTIRRKSKSPPKTQRKAQALSQEIRHGLDKSKKAAPGEFLWCICGSKYTTKSSLTLHIRNQTQQTNFICGSCKKVFSSFKGVKNHMVGCTGGFSD